MKLEKNYQKVLVFIILLAFACTMFLPIFSTINLSLKAKKEMYRDPTSIVQDPTLDNYESAAKKTKMKTLYLNSLFILVVGTGGCILLSTLVAFPVARKYVKGNKLVYMLILVAMSIPPALIPMYRMMNLLHLTNSLWGVSLYQMVTMMPTGVFIILGFIDTIPIELDESAAIDGCGYFRYIFTILIPLLRPALATSAIFIGLTIWNDFFSAFLYLADSSKRTVSSGLYLLRGEFSTQYNLFSAGLMLMLIPITVFYIFFQNKITEGMTAGSVKG